MLLLHAANIDADALGRIEIVAARNNLRRLDAQGSVVWCNEDYSIVDSSDGLLVFRGLAHSSGMLLNASRISNEGTLECLRYAVGPFVALKLISGRLTIVRGLYGSSNLFYRRISEFLVFATSLELLLALQSSASNALDFNYCTSFILEDDGFGGDTIFVDVKEVLLGELLRSDFQVFEHRELFNRPFVDSDSPVAALKGNLEYYCERSRDTILMMSGGLDSATLFYLLVKRAKPFRAVHLESRAGLGESEAREAQVLADKLAHPLIVLPPQSRVQAMLAEPDNRETSGTVNAFSNVTSLILSGQGGDQVFLQNPERNVCFDAFAEHGVLAGVREAWKYSNLKKDCFYATLRFGIRAWIGGSQALKKASPPWLIDAPLVSRRDHYLLRDVFEGSAKYRHLRGVLSALDAAGDPMCVSSPSLAPLLLQNVVGHVTETPVRELFDAKHDRILLRRAIGLESGEEFAWRRTKRPSSAALMADISAKYSKLSTLLCEGRMAQHGLIDRDILNRQLTYSAVVSITADFHFVGRLLAIESTCARYADYML